MSGERAGEAYAELRRTAEKLFNAREVIEAADQHRLGADAGDRRVARLRARRRQDQPARGRRPSGGSSTSPPPSRASPPTPRAA